jgi:hypothetical protein
VPSERDSARLHLTKLRATAEKKGEKGRMEMGECDLKRLVFDARKFLSVMNLWEAVADSGQHRSCERPIQACEHLNVRNRRRKSLQNKSNVVIQNEYAIHDGREKFTRCKSVSSPRSHLLRRVARRNFLCRLEQTQPSGGRLEGILYRDFVQDWIA